MAQIGKGPCTGSDPLVSLKTLDDAQCKMASLCAPAELAGRNASLMVVLRTLEEVELRFNSVGIWNERYRVSFMLASGYSSHMYQRQSSHTEWSAPDGYRAGGSIDTGSAEGIEHLRAVLSEINADLTLGGGDSERGNSSCIQPASKFYI